ncbi:hypothetical protein A7K94_0208015 [Modestobacter sp. VKM Ac-2676]|nr:hypothetical protein A7K94_0208015 [Modestobacter sp. VKM Ac-2676]
MTPRPRVRFLRADQPVADLLALAAETGHARFPVEGESVDDVVGVVHFKHAMGVPPAQRATRTVGEVMVQVRAVPETVELDPLLETLRGPGLQLAVVVDEYGGTAGIVTLEDLIEEIVGEIDDEQDAPVHRQRQAPDGSWVLSGLLRPDEAGDAWGSSCPTGRAPRPSAACSPSGWASCRRSGTASSCRPGTSPARTPTASRSPPRWRCR